MEDSKALAIFFTGLILLQEFFQTEISNLDRNTKLPKFDKLLERIIVASQNVWDLERYQGQIISEAILLGFKSPKQQTIIFRISDLAL